MQTEAPATAYLLYEQVTHVKPSFVYLPALHSVQTEALADEYLPAAQVRHAQVKPLTEYLPASQSSHGLPCENLPGVHSVQTEPPATEYLPYQQMLHWSRAVAPIVVEYEPALQSVQPKLPAAVLYLPTPHAVHVPPSGPEYPATHTQSVAASLPVAD